MPGDAVAAVVSAAGWNIVLEHILGVASVARAWSGSLDAVLGGAIKNSTFHTIGQLHVTWLSEYLDFVALAIVLVGSS